MNNNELLLNPNTIGVYSALIVAIIIVLQKFKVINNNLIVWFMFSYAILIGLLTVSRTFLLIITVLFLLYLFSSIIKKNIISFFVGVGLFIAALMVFLSNTQLSRTIHARLFESDDISGSRFLIYKEYLNVIFSNENIFLIGVGMQDYLEKVKDFNYAINQSTHNMILETLVIWGILGLISVLCLFISLIYNSHFWLENSFSDSLIKLFPIIVVILSAQFGQYFISFYHTFSITLLALVYLSIKEGVRDD
ncbi:Lipid A core-O-antigen ligase and related enzymes [Mycobacteroides abscessus subsp. abscessus]|nr:Lipid A core-O-antigen ligase and related enzymes [Mycobacteroides abscessus subsp. abscessus]